MKHFRAWRATARMCLKEKSYFGLANVIAQYLLRAAGLGALALTSVLQDKRFPRNTQESPQRMKQQAQRAAAGKPRSSAVLQTALIAAAVALIILGIFNGSARDVLYKAVTICTECVGLG